MRATTISPLFATGCGLTRTRSPSCMCASIMLSPTTRKKKALLLRHIVLSTERYPSTSSMAGCGVPARTFPTIGTDINSWLLADASIISIARGLLNCLLMYPLRSRTSRYFFTMLVLESPSPSIISRTVGG